MRPLIACATLACGLTVFTRNTRDTRDVECADVNHVNPWSNRPAPGRSYQFLSMAEAARATLCYMRTVSHREMRNSSGEILRAVAAGETVQVTNNGQVAAVISPPAGGSLERLIAQGLARPARRSVADLSSIRRRTAKRTSAELIRDARGRW